MDIKSKEIQIVKTSDIKMRKNNRNKHGQDQIERLAELFKYHGFRNPIIVSNQSGEIVAGNGRYLAALRAGLKEIPVIYQDFDSMEQEYSYHVSDNGISAWADLDLSGINSDLEFLGPDFDIDMLGIHNFTLDLEDKSFEPGSIDDQGKLDEKQMTKCPCCGEIFDHAKNKANT